MFAFCGVLEVRDADASDNRDYQRALSEASLSLISDATRRQLDAKSSLFPCHEPVTLLSIRPIHPDDMDDKADAIRLLSIGGAVGKIVHIEGAYVGILSLRAASKLLNAVDTTDFEHDFAIARSFPLRDPKFVSAQLEMLLFWLDCYSDETGKSALIFDFLVSKASEGRILPKYLHPAIEAIDEHDAQHETEWHKTLFSYLKHDSRAQRCGEELYLHRNAVLYRLKRIREYTGIDLEDPYERAYLRISLIPW